MARSAFPHGFLAMQNTEKVSTDGVESPGGFNRMA